jgi:hypothetical protein
MKTKTAVVVVLCALPFGALAIRLASSSSAARPEPETRGVEERRPVDDASAATPASPVFAEAFRDDAAATLGRAPAAAELVAVSVDDFKPVGSRAWRCTVAGAADAAPLVVDAETDDDGRMRLPPGVYRVQDALEELATLEATVEAAAGVSSIFFVRKKAPPTLLVTTLSGAPIEGARCEWTTARRREPLRADLDWSDPRERPAAPQSATTDAEGRATFDDVSSPFGALTVVARGFERAERVLRGGVDGTIVVALRPSLGESTRVRAILNLDGSPAIGVAAYDGDGSLVAEAPPDSAELELPPWAASLGSLVFRGPNVFPTVASRDDYGDGALEVFACSVAALRVVDSALPGGDVYVSCRPKEPSSPLAALASGWKLREGVPFEIPVPAGMKAILVATNVEGRFVRVETEFRERRAETTLVLDDVDRGLELRVRDESGGPVLGVEAIAHYVDGRELRVRSPDAGVLRIPEAEAVSWIFLEPRGYARASLRRADGATAAPSSTGTPTLTVVVRRAADVPIVVRTSEGRPSPGARVRLRRANPAAPEALAWTTCEGVAFEAQAPRHIAGETDAAGRFVARDVAVGRASIVVESPLRLRGAFGASDFFGTAVVDAPADGSEIVVVCDPPRLASLDVREASTGLPVDSFVLSTKNGPTRAVEGPLWQGWIAPDAALSVFVPNIGRAEVPIGAAFGARPYRVDVRSDAPVTVEVVGLPSDFASELQIEIFRREERGSIHLVSIPFDPRAGTVRPFAIPDDGELSARLRLRREDGGASILFAPEFAEWRPGGRIRFVVAK